MLNEERIRLMTRMAAFEEREGKKDISVSGYFRGDYISFQVLKSALYATFGFAVAVVMYILYDLEKFLTDFYKMDIVAFCQDLLVRYAAVLAVYLLISYFVYSYRYNKAKRHLRTYSIQLRELHALYESEGRRQSPRV
ncbi:MAG: hypothetical protein QM697_04735 [Lachnospiraceae bacterium]